MATVKSNPTKYKAPDQAHDETDREIAELEKRIMEVYGQASRELERKLEQYTSDFVIADKQWQKDLKDGKVTQEEYDRWKKGNVFNGQRWEIQRQNALNIMTNANQKALEIVNGKTLDVFANNANHVAYDMEHGTGANFGFTLYDSNAVENMIRNDPKLMPDAKKTVDIPKDKQWNMRTFNNVITQGIIQGNSIPNLSRKLAVALGEKNAKSMSMHARTALGAAQNAGRQKRYEEAEEKGIDLKKEWIATLDDRTRDTHMRLHGQIVPVDEDFEIDGYKIAFPCDPSADPEMVWNCRCTMKADVDKYPSKYKPLTDEMRKEMTEKSYDEWFEQKAPEYLDIYENAISIDIPSPVAIEVPVESGYVDSGYYKTIVDELPKREEIKNHKDVVGFTQSILDVYAKNGNIQYDHSVQATSSKRKSDRGFCMIDSKTNKERLYYNQISISNYAGKLGIDEEMKTAFHETFHFALNGQKWDGDLGYGSISNKWRTIEETMTEAAAQFMSKEYGLDLSQGVPSYESYLINNLPKMKQLEKYQECETIEDFGRIAWIDRIEKNADDSGSGVWLELYQEMSKVTLPDDYYSEYIQYGVEHKEEILPKIVYSFAGSADKYVDQISMEYDSCLEKATTGVKMEMNEPTIYNKVIAVAMKEMGVK